MKQFLTNYMCECADISMKLLAEIENKASHSISDHVGQPRVSRRGCQSDSETGSSDNSQLLHHETADGRHRSNQETETSSTEESREIVSKVGWLLEISFILVDPFVTIVTV